MYKDIMEEQFYLLDLGVSFEYSDSIDNQTRKDLIIFLGEWRKEHPRNPLI